MVNTCFSWHILICLKLSLKLIDDGSRQDEKEEFSEAMEFWVSLGNMTRSKM